MKRVLPIIVLSQFFCTSLWFAGNAVMTDIIKQFHVSPNYLAHLTSAVQLGFITGTLIFAVFNLADRISPSLVFFISSAIAALANLGIAFNSINISGLLLIRFLTGFFLAGIYPVGMKIASDYYQKGLGKSLGFLVGALVLGISFPHFIKSMTLTLPWKYVIYYTSSLAALGGIAMLVFVPDGPYHHPGSKIDLTAFSKVFRHKDFRIAAFGYFGHMWELYTFWVFVPVMLATYKTHYPLTDINIPLLSFMIISAGFLFCIVSGFLSQRFGAKKVATASLLLSCTCCIVSPLFLFNSSVTALIIFLFIWSMAVIADSPMFSTLVAQNAPERARGTSLTIVTSIGFFITIISIQFIATVKTVDNARYIYMLLA